MNLLNVVLPWWIKPAAILVLVGGVWFHGYHKGALSEESVRNELVARVSQAAFEQEKKTLNKIIEQKDISHATEVRLNRRLAAVNKRLRERPAPSRITVVVPALPDTPTVIAPAVADPLPANTELEDKYDQLQYDCTKTTIIADEWQKWAVENLKP